MSRALVALLLFVCVPAGAFNITQRNLDGNVRPIRWMYSGTPIQYRQNLANAPAMVPGLVDEAFATWQGVPSSQIAFTRGADTTALGFDLGDSQNVISYDDPEDDLETGVLAAAVAWVPSSTTHSWDGTLFYAITQGDIVFNDGVTFTDSAGASLLGGCISGRTDAEAVALHEIGHFFGLAHNDAGYSVAIMYPAISDCDPNRTSPRADDVNAVTYLYDSGIPPVYPAFDAAPRKGYAPLSVTFQDQSTGNVTSRSWDFGDGGSSTSANPSHTYTSAGFFDVVLAVNGSAELERVDFIEVYAMPSIAFSADVTEGTAPLTVAFTNETTGAGSDPRYRWRFGVDGAVLVTPGNPEYVYEEPGTYTVELEVDAGGGYTGLAKEAYIQVKAAEDEGLLPGCACRVAGGPSRQAGAHLSLGLAAALVVLARRRNRA